MPINITSLQINNDITGSSSSIGLKANLFNKCTATININAYKLYQANGVTGVEFAPVGYGSGNCIKIISGGGGFQEFDVGEEIQVIASTSNDDTYIIIEKISNSVIRVDSALTSETSTVAAVKGTYTFTSIEFQYGLIGNSEAINFNSKIDGNVQRYLKNTVTTSHTTMSAMGTYSSWKWHNSYPTIKEISPATSTVGQDFEIIHVFYLLPPFLYDNTSVLPPTWFASSECLKYVFSLKAKFYPASTEGVLYREFSIGGGGNTGWLNENYNTGTTTYSISDVAFAKVSDSSLLDGVMLASGDKTRVTFDIDNSVSSFSNTNTKVKVHIQNVPFDTDEYINTTTEGDVNFTFDTALNTLGSAAVDGEMTNCIEDFTCTYVSATKCTVQFDVNLDPTDVARINGYTTKKYLIAVSVCDHTLAISSSDAVTLLVDYDDYAIATGTDDVVTADTWQVFAHPQFVAEATEAQTECFSEDELRSILLLKIDCTTSIYTPSLRSFECGIRLVNTVTGDVVDLDRFFLDVSGNPVVNGLQMVNQSVNRGHKAMLTEEFKRILIKRELAMDTTDTWYYTIDFPFLIGWEDWQSNPAIPTDFFDIALENNGLNNEWAHLVIADYEVQIYCNATIRFNGIDYEYNVNRQIIPYTYESNTDEWINPDIKTYDINGTEISDFILGYDLTKVVCEFEYAGSATLTTSDVEIVMRIEPKDAGGRNVSTRFSSVFELTSETQWESYNSSNKIIKSLTGSIFKGTAVIDNALLQSFGEFDITARIYDLTAITIDGAKLKEDGDFKYTEAGDYKLLE